MFDIAVLHVGRYEIGISKVLSKMIPREGQDIVMFARRPDSHLPRKSLRGIGPNGMISHTYFSAVLEVSGLTNAILSSIPLNLSV